MVMITVIMFIEHLPNCRWMGEKKCSKNLEYCQSFFPRGTLLSFPWDQKKGKGI
jgi:hypothetical protein